MHDLTQIAGVDIAPRVALAAHRVGEVAGEVGVFMRFNDVADPERVNVRLVAHGKGAAGLFVHDLGQTIAVHRVAVVILFQREGMVILVAFGKADAICRLGTRKDHLADPKFHRGLQHVIGADGVLREGGVVGVDHHPGDGGEMHDGIGRFGGEAVVIAVKAEMGGEGVEHLPAVGDVGDQRVDAGMVKGFEVDVQDLVALGQQVRHSMAPGLAGSAGENDALGHGYLRQCG